MKSYELYDLLFLLRALRIEAHAIKKTHPGYAKLLFDKLDKIQPITEQQ